MKVPRIVLRYAAISVVAALFLAGPLHAAKDDVPTPKEYGVYVKTATKLVRLLPNIVFQDGAMLYVESNNPPHFPLKDIKYFIFYGKHDMHTSPSITCSSSTSPLSANPASCLEKWSRSR